MATTNKVNGLSIEAARTGVKPIPEAAPTTKNTGSIPPVYGANVSGYDPAKEAQNKIAGLGQQWASAGTQAEKDAIHGQAQAIGVAAGGTYNSKTGQWSFPSMVDTAQAPEIPPTFTAPTEQQYIPQFTPSMPVMDEAAIRKYAQDQIAAKLATLRQSADQSISQGKLTADRQLQGLQTGYDRQRETMGEDRSLQDVQAARNLSPFSGRSDYALGMIEMGRARTDREMQQDHLSRQANIQQDLANLENEINQKYALMEQLAPDEQEKMFQEIKRDERNYEMMLRGELRSDLLANSQLNDSNFNRALQTYGAQRSAFESDRGFGYDMYRDNVNWTGYVPQGGYNGGMQGFAAQGGAGAQTYGGLNTQSFTPQAGAMRTLQGQQFDRNVYEDDRNFNFQKTQQEWENMFKTKQFDEDKAARLWEQAFKDKSFAQDVKDAAASRGLQWASLNQREKEFIADQAFREKQFNLEKDKFNFQKNQPGDVKPNDIYSEAVSALDGMTPAQRKAFFNGEKTKIIQQLGPSGYNTLYNMYFDEDGEPK